MTAHPSQIDAALERARAAAASEMPAPVLVHHDDARPVLRRTTSPRDIDAKIAREKNRLGIQYPDDGPVPPPALICSARLP
jgi:hypothetical protein